MFAILAALVLSGQVRAQCECPADLDASEAIGFSDLTIMLNAWGACPGGCPADLDGTEDVGFSDLTTLLNAWGPCPPTSDSDGDTVPDCADQCPGEDDTIDTDLDTVPDCADLCPGVDDTLDADGDTVPDCVDQCPGEDDTLDDDADGVPNCLDICPGEDDTLDTDLDTVPDCLDQCPGEDDNLDTDGDTVPDCLDICPGFPDDLDSDGDTVPDCVDVCPGFDDLFDSDGDSVPNCLDGCPDDGNKTDPGACGCGVADDDSDGDTVPDCLDQCPGEDDNLDTDGDTVPDCLDICPGFPDDLDSDGDTVPDCVDVCPGFDDLFDSDGDSVPNCLDGCPDDGNKTDPGACGCGVADDDTDGDTVPDCVDQCPGQDDNLDTDGDSVPDCFDQCPGQDDTLDTDGDTVPDCVDLCPGQDDNLDTDADTVPDCLDICPGEDDNLDTDADTVPDCLDICPGEDDNLDTDADTVPDCLDQCPGEDDTIDSDLDTVPDCVDQCPGEDDTIDADMDGTPDCADGCPNDPNKTEPGLCGCGVIETPGCTSSLISDDFNDCVLDTLVWSVTDPSALATVDLVGAGSDDAYLRLTLPGGVDYDAWVPTNTAVRAMQAAADEDFQVELKFDSVPTQRFQIQGVLVEEDANNFLRVDFYSNGSTLFFFSATVTNGVATVRSADPVPTGSPVYLRLTRTNDDWGVEYSYDGQSWTPTGAFTHAMNVTAIGPYAGSAGTPAPGFVAQVDYFFNTSMPVVPEDGPVGAGSTMFTLDITSDDGMVMVDPDLPFFDCGDSVTLTALPDVGFSFNGWSGDVSSFDNPLTFQMTDDTTIIANYLDNSIRAIITDIEVIPSDDSAIVRWTTDIAADSSVRYGETTEYEGGTLFDPTLVTEHELLLIDLTPDTTYNYEITSTNVGGTPTTTVNLTFDTLLPGSSAFGATSDDFNSFNVDASRWTFTDPVGDASLQTTDVNTTDASLRISLPVGAHDLFPLANNTARLMQPANNTDFDVIVKFTSVPGDNHIQGIFITEDAEQYFVTSVKTNGTATSVSVLRYDGASDTLLGNVLVGQTGPYYLRVTRTDSTWDFWFSLDGATWVPSASVVDSLVVHEIGVYAASRNSATTPFDCVVDYFEVNNDPIPAEDGSTSIVNDTPPFVYHLNTTAVRNQDGSLVDVTWDTDESADSVVDYGLTQTYELGQVSDATLTTSHAIRLSLGALETYELLVSSMDAQSNLGARMLTVPVDVTGAPTIDLWFGSLLTIGDIGLATPFVNVLGNVDDPDGVADLYYSVNGGAISDLTIGSNQARLQNEGDFNADIPIGEFLNGTNEVEIVSIDNNGETAIEYVTVEYDDANVWPLPYTIDWSTLTDIEDVYDVAVPIDGKWQLDGGGIRSVEPGYDRLIGIGDLAWDRYEITVPVTVHAIDPIGYTQSNGIGIGIMMRWPGHTPDNYQPDLDFTPFGALCWHQWSVSLVELYRLFLNPGYTAAQDFGTVMPIGVEYTFRCQVTTFDAGGQLAPRYRMKYWPSAEAEPANWNLEADGSPGDPLGGLMLVSHHTDATFGNVTIVPVPAE